MSSGHALQTTWPSNTVHYFLISFITSQPIILTTYYTIYSIAFTQAEQKRNFIAFVRIQARRFAFFFAFFFMLLQLSVMMYDQHNTSSAKQEAQY